MAVDLEWLKIKSDSDLLLWVPGNHVTGITWEVEGVGRGGREENAHTRRARCRHNELCDQSPWFLLSASRYGLISEVNTRRSLSSRGTKNMEEIISVSESKKISTAAWITLPVCIPSIRIYDATYKTSRNSWPKNKNFVQNLRLPKAIQQRYTSYSLMLFPSTAVFIFKYGCQIYHWLHQCWKWELRWRRSSVNN